MKKRSVFAELAEGFDALAAERTGKITLGGEGHELWIVGRAASCRDALLLLQPKQLIERNAQVGWTELLFDPMWTFFRTLVLQRGFLDGTEGFAIAYMASVYNFLKYAKVRFMRPHE